MSDDEAFVRARWPGAFTSDTGAGVIEVYGSQPFPNTTLPSVLVLGAGATEAAAWTAAARRLRRIRESGGVSNTWHLTLAGRRTFMGALRRSVAVVDGGATSTRASGGAPPGWTLATRQLAVGWLADATAPGGHPVITCRGNTEAEARERVRAMGWAIARACVEHDL